MDFDEHCQIQDGGLYGGKWYGGQENCEPSTFGSVGAEGYSECNYALAWCSENLLATVLNPIEVGDFPQAIAPAFEDKEQCVPAHGDQDN